MSKHYYFWFLIRRFILAMSLIFFSFNGCIQTGIAIFLSLTELNLLFKVKPFRERLQNILQIFDSACLTALIVMIFVLYEKGYGMEDSEAMRLGYVMILIVGIYFLVNMGVVVVNAITQIGSKCKECRKKKSRVLNETDTDFSSSKSEYDPSYK